MLSFKVGNSTVTIYFWPLLVAFIIATVVMIFYAIFLFKRNKKLMELCRIGKYNDSIALAKKQLNYFQRTPMNILYGGKKTIAIKKQMNYYQQHTLKNKNTKSAVDMIYLTIAVSYLGLSNDDQFLHNIAQVTDKNPEKHFWLALFYLTKKHSTEFQTEYEILSSSHMNENYMLYLSSINKLQECNDADARNTLLTLKSKINFKLLQDTAQKIIDQ